MKTIFSLALMSLLMTSFSLIMPKEQNAGRLPASFEKRVTSEERTKRIEEERQIQDLNKKYQLLLKLRGELAEVERQNAQLQESLEFFQSQMMPLNSLGDNNEGLANYLRLIETNQGYKMQDFEGVFQYGEMNNQAEALYYGLPMAQREKKAENQMNANPYYQIEPLQNHIVEIY